MNRIFENAKWIWSGEDTPDKYVDFLVELDYTGGEAVLNISCDHNYAIYVNDVLAAFGQYPDYPHYKIAEQENLTTYLRKGKNKIIITAYHQGGLASTYFTSSSGVIFSLRVNGKEVAFSDESTPSRINLNYKNGYCKLITSQLGFSFLYNATNLPCEFSSSRIVDKQKDFYIRPVKKLVLEGRAQSKFINSEVVDFYKETVGFLDLDFYSDCEQTITISYAEHLTDGQVSRFVGPRDFSVEYVAKKGENKYLNPFLRLGCRYLSIQTENPIKINYVGINKVSYPFDEKVELELSGDLKKIYQTAKHTLKMCAHDHYEDNPWREQSMYVLDSRNQMLCGYYLFNDNEYQRANLITISKSQQKDGLLSICAPSSKNTAIPSFSLIFPVAVEEYIAHTGDKSILKEVYEVCKQIINVFIKRIDKNNLIAQFPYPYWNFYEWSKCAGNSADLGRTSADPCVVKYDLLLNTLFLYSLNSFEKLATYMGEEVLVDKNGIKNAVNREFLIDGKYVIDKECMVSSSLGNSLAILTGVAQNPKELADKIKSGEGMEDITLSTATFMYDALLLADPDNKEFILSDIRKKYNYMLDCGATTFWETILGAKDFDYAGSLCHGWSAVPVYYFHKFFCANHQF